MVVGLWWSERYNLPPSDERFLARNEGEHFQDLFSWLLRKLDNLAHDHANEKSDTHKRFAIFKHAKEVAKQLDMSERDIYEKFGRLHELESDKWGDHVEKTGQLPPGVEAAFDQAWKSAKAQGKVTSMAELRKRALGRG